MSRKDYTSKKQLNPQPKQSRRDFIQMSAALGVGVSTTFASSLWSQAQADTPQKGGTIRIGADGGTVTDTFNPLVSLGVDHTQSAMFATFDTLTEIDGNGKPQPSLAESWEGSKDGTWAIQLRKGVEFHDGKALTAKDVVWSLMQHKREDSKYAEGKAIVGNLEKIKADGDHTVILKQKEVNFDMPSLLSSFGLLIGQEGNEDWDKGIGTGPYRLKKFDPGVSYQGEKFENFYRDDQGYFNEVEILNVADAAARASALLSGSLDVIGSPDIVMAKRLGRVKGFNMVEVSGTQHYTTDMRTDSESLSNKHVRNAVKWGIKREEIVQKILGGFGTVGNDIPLARNQQFYNDQLPQREYDPEKAKWHLEQAGLSSADLTLHTSDGAFAGAVNMAILMKESLKDAGINLNVKREPADGYWSNVWRKAPWSASYYNGRPTADWMLSSQYSSTSEWDATFFKNEKFDALLKAARVEADEKKRQELYFEAQKMLWDEGGAVVLAFANILIAASDKLGHGQVGVSRRLDDARLARRWWFV